MRTAFVALCFFVSSMIPFQAMGAPSQAQVKKNMLSQLDFIHDVFETKYAPAAWKKAHLGWDLDLEYEKAKARVEAMKTPTTREYHYILKDFFNSTQDYHVSIRFFSTEAAMLPFTIKGAEGRYFVSFVQKELLPPGSQIQVGDEVISFNDKPIRTVIEELRSQEFGQNTPETDFALTELLLTNRDGSSGCRVPSGPAKIALKKRSGRNVTLSLNWIYVPEQIKEFASVGASTVADERISLATVPGQKTIRQSSFFHKLMVSPLWDPAKATFDVNPHAVGGKKSFIPDLGRKIWGADPNAIFSAYIFLTPSGKQIGYIRIPHYMGDDVDVEEFADTIKLFEKHTDALVIDQINNPGGSIFYLYALASTLTDQPLAAPKHHLVLTQDEVNLAVSLLPLLELVKDDATAQEYFGDSFDGYPVDYRFATLMREFCQLIVDEWNAGHFYTKATHIFGVEQVQPHNTSRYTKPILLLTNSLCFSGGDFFPAILQDNKRATILGTRTAGAGGYILRTKFPNHLGIRDFHLTASLAERIEQKPLENLGVTPDISYACSVKDLQENYPEYSIKIVQEVEKLINSKE